MIPVHAPAGRSDDETRVICIMIVLFAGVSFRSVPRVLRLFLQQRVDWIPHFTSVINWSLRIGLALLSQVALIDAPWVAILDHSIDVGIKKVLVVLRVRLDALQKGSALTLEDCQCIGLQVSEKTDGDTIANGLKQIFGKAGAPVAIIKDGGPDLARGVSLWQEQAGQKKVMVIDDIGHVIANAIKAQYSNSKLFKQFLKIINRCAKKLRQTKLAFLAPPKLRTKGRFQGIAKLAAWAQKIMDVLDETRQDQQYKKLRASLFGLGVVKGFIQRFAESVLTTSEIMKILKNEGLSSDTYHRCKELTAALPERSVVKARISKWLDKHLHIQGLLGIGQTPLIVSSDIIESLFGKFKNILDRGSMLDMNRSVLLIPALCASPNATLIHHALANTKHQDLEAWDLANIPYTQNRRRRDFLQGKSASWVPETGNFSWESG